MTLNTYQLIPITDLSLRHSEIERLQSCGFITIADLLLLAPRYFEDRKTLSTLEKARGEEAKAVKVHIVAHSYVRWKTKRVLKIHIQDNYTNAVLTCFGRNFLAKSLPPETDIYLWAKFSFYRKEWSSSSFDFEICTSAPPKKFFRIIARYPLSGNISEIILKKGIKNAWIYVKDNIQNDIPDPFLERRNLMPIPQAIQNLHFPSSVKMARHARKSLAYREFFYLHLQLWDHKKKEKHQVRMPYDTSLQEKMIHALPFSLTCDQEKVLSEINNDIFSPIPMFRLLQGDVGCGKTLIALLAVLATKAKKQQSLFIAPTALLAQQHFSNAYEIFNPMNVTIGLLHGKLSTKKRNDILQQLQNGTIDLIIGTHALLSDTVSIKNLGLVIIDEQQRFGVTQRTKLIEEHDIRPDVLIMTATPIPRTLLLTLFSHNEVSTIKTMPPRRIKIKTHLSTMSKREKVYHFVEKELEKGFQVYFVCPRIEKDSTHQSTETLAQQLQERFNKYTIAVLHSKIEEKESIRIMQSFYSGESSILIATSVIEVGIDVPKATCMIIEHAELFGISTLHQLRGRVGRSHFPSYTFLIYQEPLTEVAKERLKALYECNDGFELSERDLLIRGPGDIAGTKQSGYLKLKIADLRRDISLLQISLEDIRTLLSNDPELQSSQYHYLKEQLMCTQSTPVL